MLQDSSAGITTVTLLQKDSFHYKDHLTTEKLRHVNKRLMDKLMLIFRELNQLCQDSLIFDYIIVAFTKAFINKT